eukprot:4730830-Amphidinium_carterae.1
MLGIQQFGFEVIDATLVAINPATPMKMLVDPATPAESDMADIELVCPLASKPLLGTPSPCNPHSAQTTEHKTYAMST